MKAPGFVPCLGRDNIPVYLYNYIIRDNMIISIYYLW